jgi:hypothetical protein
MVASSRCPFRSIPEKQQNRQIDFGRRNFTESGFPGLLELKARKLVDFRQLDPGRRR